MQTADRDSRPAVEVVAILRAWGRAANLDAARKTLRSASRKLAAAQREELTLWTARLSIESLVDVMSLMEGLETDERVEWQGLVFHPRQIERLEAWVKDQIGTAEALGVERAAWVEVINGAIGWLQGRARNRREGPEADAIKAAKKFLGG